MNGSTSMCKCSKPVKNLKAGCPQPAAKSHVFNSSFSSIFPCASGRSFERAKGESQHWSCDSPQPVTFAGVGVAADSVVLIGQPDDEDDVEGRCRVIEEFRHYGLHSCKA